MRNKQKGTQIKRRVKLRNPGLPLCLLFMYKRLFIPIFNSLGLILLWQFGIWCVYSHFQFAKLVSPYDEV